MGEEQFFPCAQCGAKLEFDPAASAQVCTHCGFENAIETADEPIEELNYTAHMAELAGQAETVDVITVKCVGCGAESTQGPSETAGKCPFCGAAIVSTAQSHKLIKPASLLPFGVTKEQARDSYRKWIHGLWFAPNALRRNARQDTPVNGMYCPYWTYDTNTVTRYKGQRGDYYYTTESYTTTVNGKSVRRTRQVRKTRWRSASGTVSNAFDDVLVVASQSLPRQYAEALEPWDLQNLVPYKDDYLAGFRAESYQVDLVQGFERAKELMAPTIHQTICRDIGGDEQRVSWTSTQYNRVTFKHTLLPVWISAYRYGKKTYRFLVNARTGEVQGERPWSWVKITLAVLAGVAVVGAIAAIIAANQ
ncbi:MAG: hypothetical protein AMXMBFR84_01320 [Candidatus Hydrogenedentota bacterium]